MEEAEEKAAEILKAAKEKAAQIVADAQAKLYGLFEKVNTRLGLIIQKDICDDRVNRRLCGDENQNVSTEEVLRELQRQEQTRHRMR